MDSDISKAFQEELTCVICLGILIDPVTIDCGHTFCQPCICFAWEEAEIPDMCPVCRGPSRQRDLKTNIILKHLVSIARKASLRQCLSSEEHQCEIHKEAKQTFCEVEKELLCKLCSQSPGHRNHRHCSIEGAAEQQQELMLKQMRSLWDKIQENKRNMNQQLVLVTDWICYVYTYRQLINNTYEMLLPELQEEAKKHSDILSVEESTTLQQLERRKTQMLNKNKQLRKMYQELLKTYQNPDVELLKDLKYILRRCESLLVFLPQPMNPKLSGLPMSGLIEELNQYRVEISFNQEPQNPDVMLFDYVRKLINGQDNDDVFLNSDGSSDLTAWGVNVFSSGKHYWELSVDDSWDWALGVCRNSGVRKNSTIIDSEDIFLLLCVKGSNDSHLFTSSPFLSHYMERPVGRIGVFLDFENGNLSFFNVAKSSFIWKYPTGYFQFPVRPFFATSHT
ncbi:tripartite motif-containing protein 43-like [Dipodomys spectabilis]|uniref:tripartite motif-containing protein 43-like n=1 Tax=Dipodomys spectabilis TaxID=105255 RepID=UPI001C5471C9|nr:tripartite motif-containing protein 43-like [Dipodomys spectabilis]